MNRYQDLASRIVEALDLFDVRHANGTAAPAIATQAEAEAAQACADLDEAYRRLDVAGDPDFGSEAAVVAEAYNAAMKARVATTAGLNAIAAGVGSRGLRRAFRHLAETATVLRLDDSYTEEAASAYVGARHNVGRYAEAHPWIAGMTIPSV